MTEAIVRSKKASVVTLAFLATFSVVGLSVPAQAESPVGDAAGGQAMTRMSDLVDASALEFNSIDGDPMSLDAYSGQVVLVVNTASKCGYTPQFDGLQSLWTTYKDAGLVVVGVPSGDFANQEFEEEAEVARFCRINYGVDFPLTEKNHVIGEDAHPFFGFAEEHLGESATPRWNFHKILIGRDGMPLRAFPSAVAPEDEELISAVEGALG